MRILVIEDDPDSAAMLVAVLKLWGHAGEVRLTGREGVEAAQELRPDAVICDLGLPGELSGFEVAALLRGAPATRALRLIALTGHSRSVDARRCIEAGFDAYLAKPVVIPELQAALAAGEAAAPSSANLPPPADLW